jgi:hypothetical protein
MNNLEIVTSQEYQDLLRKLNPSMSFEPEMVDINKMIEFFKFQSNPDDKVSYMEEHMVTYEIMKNTHFFIEFKNLTLIGLYTNKVDKEYFILVKRDGSIHFIGDSIINWTNYEYLPFISENVFEFQTACFYKYNIPTVTWLDKTIKIGKTITPDDFNNDVNYQSYLKSDMLYDTYRYLKEFSVKGDNLQRIRGRIRGITDSEGVLVYYVNEKFKVVECILDSRFFNGINTNTLKGFIDLDIRYTYHEDGLIDIYNYKVSKPSLFNIAGFFSGFKERLRLYSICFTMLRIMVKLYSIVFFIELNDDFRKFK